MGVVEWSWLRIARLQTQVEGWLQWCTPAWRGQSTVEYALVGALVVLAAATAMTALGSEVTAVFTRITGQLTGAANAGTGH